MSREEEEHQMQVNLAMTDEQLRRKMADLMGSAPKFEPHQLFRLERTNATVGHFLEAWKSGRFASLEQMLLGLALSLAHNNGKLLEQCVRLQEIQTVKLTLPFGAKLPTVDADAEAAVIATERPPEYRGKTSDEIKTIVTALLNRWLPGTREQGYDLVSFLSTKSIEIREQIQDVQACGGGT